MEVIMKEEIPRTKSTQRKADETQTLDGCLSGVRKPVQLISLSIPLPVKNDASNSPINKSVFRIIQIEYFY
jgi:hypothetical protein